MGPPARDSEHQVVSRGDQVGLTLPSGLPAPPHPTPAVKMEAGWGWDTHAGLIVHLSGHRGGSRRLLWSGLVSGPPPSHPRSFSPDNNCFDNTFQPRGHKRKGEVAETGQREGGDADRTFFRREEKHSPGWEHLSLSLCPSKTRLKDTVCS